MPPVLPGPHWTCPRRKQDALLAFLVAVVWTSHGVDVERDDSTPNRAAALGENVILLVNLAGSAWLLLTFICRRTPFAALERWQTGYLPVYAAWAWIVVLVFPPLFSYV